jgi:Mg-chelatase subunit ChlI/Mg-chelatase subunit ChlD
VIAETSDGRFALVYPLTAIIGQETVKTSLILNAIDPTIGGVLISGPKGTGKSLLVRAVSDILPEIEYVADCSFRCSPTDLTNMCPNCLVRYESGERLPVAKSPMKVVSLPLSATDDALVGSLDMDRAIEEGGKALRPGLLAEANQNILYIDEVNLLPDHITDNILDAAASGWNTVEREGISVQHPSRFILVGSMNPEEGELRPQILDRFGIHASTVNIKDLNLRIQVISRNENFAIDPVSFIGEYQEDLDELRLRIEEARRRLPEVDIPLEIYTMVASICSRLRVDGFRPDIAAMKVARALAAFDGRKIVTPDDVVPSIELVLSHRTRRSGLTPPPSPVQIQKAIERSRRREMRLSFGVDLPKLLEVVSLPKELINKFLRRAVRNRLVTLIQIAMMMVSITILIENLRTSVSHRPMTAPIIIVEGILGGLVSLLLAIFLNYINRKRGKVGEDIKVLDLTGTTLHAENRLRPPRRGVETGTGGGSAQVRYGKSFSTTPEYGSRILKQMGSLRIGPTSISAKDDFQPPEHRRIRIWRKRTTSSSSRGRSAWHRIPRDKPRDVALVPTLRAAALHQHERGRDASNRLIVETKDIRVKVREYLAPSSTVLLVDMSLSMINSVRNLIRAIYGLHEDVYRRRDRVGLIVFKGSRAYVLQHPTTNLDLVVKKLTEVGASDFTPLATGLLQSLKVLKQERMRNSDAVLNLVVFSDGIVNVALDRPLSPLTRRKYPINAQADSIDAAHMLSKEKVRVHIFNTNHSSTDTESQPTRREGWRLRLTPTQFLMEMAKVSEGNYYGLSQKEGAEEPREQGWFFRQYSR